MVGRKLVGWRKVPSRIALVRSQVAVKCMVKSNGWEVRVHPLD